MPLPQKTAFKYPIYIPILAGFTIILLVLLPILLNQLHRMLAQEQQQYQEERATNLGLLVNQQVKTAFDHLKTLGETYLLLDQAQRETYLQAKAQEAPYLQLGIMNAEGLLRTTDQQTMTASQLFALQPLLQGKKVLAKDNVNSQEILVLAIPLYQQNTLLGGIVAFVNPNFMQKMLPQQESFAFITDQQGAILIQPDQGTAAENSQNFFSMLAKKGAVNGHGALEGIQQALQTGQQGHITIDFSNSPARVVYFTPLDQGDWYLFSVTPENALKSQSPGLFTILRFLAVITIGFFMGLLLVLIRRQQRTKGQLVNLAQRDPVTQGLSGAYFANFMQSTLPVQGNNTYALVSLDIRQFKLLNHIYGSKAGDGVLKHVHDVIQRQLQKEEYVARIAADIFYLLLHNDQKNKLRERLESLAQEINTPCEAWGPPYILSFDCGVFPISDPTMDFITMQDRANLTRKNNKNIPSPGLCTCSFYNESEHLQLVGEKKMENRMAEALANQEFVIYLQPKVELQKNTVVGAEALVRWQDPERGLILPNDFIPLFEKNGFITQLDLYVFEEVCKLLRKWLDQGIRPWPLSVNLSRMHINKPDFLDCYKTIQEKYSIPSLLLEIELAKTQIFENLEQLHKVINQIHALGFRCSLDDFSSHSSTVNLLKNVTVDTLKMDQMFLGAQLEQNTQDKQVIESVVELAQKLYMNTVAEGVETIPQLEFLRQVQCDIAQGYVFSKPLCVEDFEELAFTKQEQE